MLLLNDEITQRFEKALEILRHCGATIPSMTVVKEGPTSIHSVPAVRKFMSRETPRTLKSPKMVAAVHRRIQHRQRFWDKITYPQGKRYCIVYYTHNTKIKQKYSYDKKYPREIPRTF